MRVSVHDADRIVGILIPSDAVHHPVAQGGQGFLAASDGFKRDELSFHVDIEDRLYMIIDPTTRWSWISAAPVEIQQVVDGNRTQNSILCSSSMRRPRRRLAFRSHADRFNDKEAFAQRDVQRIHDDDFRAGFSSQISRAPVTTLLQPPLKAEEKLICKMSFPWSI